MVNFFSLHVILDKYVLRYLPILWHKVVDPEKRFKLRVLGALTHVVFLEGLVFWTCLQCFADKTSDVVVSPSVNQIFF